MHNWPSSRPNRPFARSGRMVRNKLCWEANNAVGPSPARLFFVLKIPLRYLRHSIIYSVPCDRIVQMAYLMLDNDQNRMF